MHEDIKVSQASIDQARLIIAQINQNSANPRDRLDADETNMLALQLEQMRSRVYEDRQLLLKARRYIPTENDIDNGADTFSYEEGYDVGQFETLGTRVKDLPSISVGARKVVRPLVSSGGSYQYSFQDMRRAAYSGKPLSTRKANATRRAGERWLDDLAAFGKPTEGIASGFVNDPSVPTISAGGTVTAILGGASGGLAMLNEMNAWVTNFITSVREIHEPTALLLPVAQYQAIAQRQMSEDNSQTVLSAFLQANPMITMVDRWDKFAGAGAGSVDRACLYDMSIDNVSLVISQEFEVFAPQLQGLEFNVPAHMRSAGTCVYRPLAMRYIDGV